MSAADYTPGRAITTTALLRDVIRHEDALYYQGVWRDCYEFWLFFSRYPLAVKAQCKAGAVRRACLKCPQTAGEMRAANERAKP